MDRNFYLSCHIDGKLVWYGSDNFILSEQELLTLIKILIKEKRQIKIGNKLLMIYCDATNDKISETEKKLNEIGVKNATPKKYFHK